MDVSSGMDLEGYLVDPATGQRRRRVYGGGRQG